MSNPSCRKFQGEVTTCRAVIENDKMGAQYSFNSQSGSLLLIDNDLGLSSETMWMNPYQVIKSGYLTTSVTLTSLKGGLLGENRNFQVIVYCKATDDDWK